MSRRLLIVLLALPLFVTSACTRGGEVPPGTDGGTGADIGPITGMTLRIEPLDQVVMITGGASQTVDYRAFLREAGGAEREVSGEVSWTSTNAPIGSFAGSTFTTATDRGGRTNIVATLAGLTTTTSLTVQLQRVVIAEGATPDAPARFGGTPSPARAPELVYPDDGVMLPPNLGELEIHYMPNGAELFELAVSAGALDLRVYFGCPESVGGGCIYTPERSVWETLATAAAGAGPITYRLRSVNSAGELGETGERTLSVAEEPITGGLYYWNAGGGSIDRFEFGVRGAQAERFIDAGRAGASTCVGCHAVSRDGTRISIGTDIPTTTFQVFDVATRERIFSLGASGGFGLPSQPNFASFSPDSRQIVTSLLSGLNILDATTGSPVAQNLGGGAGSQPDWSPDGDHIVFVRHDAPAFGGLVDVGGVTSGRITIIDRMGGTWGAPRTIVQTAGQNNYYPSYSPDGGFIAFCRSPSNINSMGVDPESGESAVPDAQLWLIPSDRSGAARQLTTIAGRADSWPKWDPTEYMSQGRPLYWLSWSSRRAFGLRLAEDQRSQLWMAAFDPMEAATGAEGVRAAFRLPFQDLETSNHIAQWVTTVERQTCTTSMDCGGEFCVDGRCFAEEPLL